MEELEEFEDSGRSLQQAVEMRGDSVHEQLAGEHCLWRSQVQVAVETRHIAAPRSQVSQESAHHDGNCVRLSIRFDHETLMLFEPELLEP